MCGEHISRPGGHSERRGREIRAAGGGVRLERSSTPPPGSNSGAVSFDPLRLILGDSQPSGKPPLRRDAARRSVVGAVLHFKRG